MRLTFNQVEIIRQSAREVFGNGVQVWLFGSRVDNSAKGGDIDLYVEGQFSPEDSVAKNCRMNALLQTRLGEQKIDVLSWTPGQARLPVYDHARQRGILL